MTEVLFATYAVLFTAEIVGDKLLYTSGVFAARFRWRAVVCGMTAAFMGKMAVAVIYGSSYREADAAVVGCSSYGGELHRSCDRHVAGSRRGKAKGEGLADPARSGGRIRDDFLFGVGR